MKRSLKKIAGLGGGYRRISRPSTLKSIYMRLLKEKKNNNKRMFKTRIRSKKEYNMSKTAVPTLIST